MQDYRRKIKEIAEGRGITSLYHFTAASNASSILCNGLASRQFLSDHGIDFHATDGWRLDGHLDAISLSIHSINMEMFHKKKRKLAGDWLILEIKASILWTHSCRFCWTNASSSEIKNERSFLGGPWAFGRMFDDKPVSLVDKSPFREKYERARCRPTDVQAEVQVFDPIDPSVIVDVTVKNEAVKRHLEGVMKDIGVVRPVAINESLFM